MSSFLSADKIKDGMSGTISAEPREEKHDFNDGKGEKTMFRVYITLDKPIMDDYAEELASEWVWSAGVFARSFLEDKLGEEYQAWINTHGFFRVMPWKSKTRSGFSWHFIPDQQPQVPIDQESIEKVEAKQLTDFPKQVPGARLREADPNQPTQPQAGVLIECAYCAADGDSWSTAKTENMLTHVQKFHPDKLPKDAAAKPKVRVKKA